MIQNNFILFYHSQSPEAETLRERNRCHNPAVRYVQLCGLFLLRSSAIHNRPDGSDTHGLIYASNIELGTLQAVRISVQQVGRLYVSRCMFLLDLKWNGMKSCVIVPEYKKYANFAGLCLCQLQRCLKVSIPISKCA